LTRLKLLVIAAAGLLAAGLLVAGCGGGDEDPEEVLTETFSGDHQVDSGTIDISVSGSAEGSSGGNLDVSLSGPFQSEEGQFPEFDLTASVSGEGAGQSLDFEGSLISTGDALFVEYQDTAYEVPDDVFKQIEKNYAANAAQSSADEGASFQEQCQKAAEQGGFDASLCDIDPFSLVTNLENEGDEDVEGAETVHISGDINLEEIGNLVGEAIAASPSGQFVPPDQIDQLTTQLEDAVDEASFDVYSGKDDRTLRRFDLGLSLAAPEGLSAFSPVSSADLDLSVTLGAVNEPQTIEAPSGAQPLDDLLDQLGVSGVPLGALGGGSVGGGGAGGLYDFDGAGGVSPGGGGGGGGGGGAGGGASDAYLECIQNAGTPEEIADCVDQL
jgi:hypothetical protein